MIGDEYQIEQVTQFEDSVPTAFQELATVHSVAVNGRSSDISSDAQGVQVAVGF